MINHINFTNYSVLVYKEEKVIIKNFNSRSIDRFIIDEQ